MNGRWRNVFRMRMRALFRRARLDRELEKELQFHLDRETAAARSDGLSLDQARTVALRKIGGITQIQEECRDMRRTNMVENMKQDIRYAVRMLARSPGFTLVMILTLALSIGATSAIVSVIEGVLLRPLPYRNPAKLVRIFTSNSAWPKFSINANDFLDFRARLHSFESLAAYTRNDMQLAANGEAVRLSGFAVTSGFFHVLGIRPALGHEFERNDERPGGGKIVIISDRLWRTRMSGSRQVLGQKIILDAVPYTIIGIMPPGFRHPGNRKQAVAYGDTVDFWTPFTFTNPDDRGSHYLDAIARLAPGVTREHAQGELNAVMRQLGKEHEGDRGWNVMVIPLDKEIVGRSERMLLVLLGAVGLVLLLACVNAANLLLARATARHREIAVRAAMGAPQSRLIQQMLTESVVLAMLGGALGVGLAFVGVKLLLALLPADFPRTGDIHVDLPVLLFTFFVAAIAGIVFGLVPALQGSKTDLRRSLHEAGRSVTGSLGMLRLRNTLVISEVTLSCALLIGAGLMLHSFVRLVETSPGFRPDHVLTASLSLPHVTYKDTKAITHFYRQLLEELNATQGVIAAGAGSDLPWTGWDENTSFTIRGETPLAHQDFHGRYHEASPGYFQALGIPAVRGRMFSQGDTLNNRPVLIINEALARYWRHGDPLGGQVTWEDHPKARDWWTVVGIVADIKDTPKNAGAESAFWWPMQQEPFPLAANSSIAIRSNEDPALVANRLRAAVRQLDPTLAVAEVRTMETVANGSYTASRFALVLVAVFAALALGLAAIGTYGVIAYAVNQRLHEFGVRMALGAKPWDVRGHVLANGMKLALAGTALGTMLGLALSRFLGNLLYGIGTADPLAISATWVIAIAVAAFACYVPALRATRIDPMEALRSD